MKRSGTEALHLAGIALVLLLVLVSWARAVGTGDGLRVESGWIRALPLAIPSAGYFTLHNDTRSDKVLVAAQSDACGLISIHKTETTGGICRMRDMPEVDVPAKGSVSFAPQSYHLMCVKARPALKPGATVAVTLIFKDGTRLRGDFSVRNAAGR